MLRLEVLGNLAKAKKLNIDAVCAIANKEAATRERKSV